MKLWISCHMHLAWPGNWGCVSEGRRAQNWQISGNIAVRLLSEQEVLHVLGHWRYGAVMVHLAPPFLAESCGEQRRP